MNTSLELRDRDAIVTEENIIFRVYGYMHPPNACICDPEYAPESVFISSEPRAFRSRENRGQVFYKFFSDEGLRFIQQHFPKYTVPYPPLRKSLVGVRRKDIKEIRQPQRKFQQLLKNDPKDSLITELQNMYAIFQARTTLGIRDFGVFGSLLHGFYHPEFSDLDFTVYGMAQLETLRGILEQAYLERDSKLENEFNSEETVKGKTWQFKNYSPKEYVWHQKRKLIYALFKGKTRVIKTEFEPVKRWEEIHNEYNPKQLITRKGWIKAEARITEDKDAPFMPSIYQIEPLKATGAYDVRRILSYVEEFRMQAKKDEIVTVLGNLEKVTVPEDSFHQITLTHGPRYYEQALKVSKPEQ